MPKTKKVRIAVAINSRGEWNCGGYCWLKTGEQLETLPDDEAAGNAIEGLESDEYVIHFVEAEIPLPVSTTVQGKVTD